MELFSLILRAPLIELLVLALLLLISIFSWVVILQRNIVVSNAKNIFENFEETFWSGIDLSKYYRDIKSEINENSGIQNVFCTGFKEFSKLDKLTDDPDVIVSSITRAMRTSITREEEHLNKYLNTLASIGSISPYIGLFGTVIGILTAFLHLSSSNTLEIQLLAPSIAEALVATALGLFTAIPAIYAYNSLSSRVEVIVNNYHIFMEEFATVLNRKIRQK